MESLGAMRWATGVPGSTPAAGQPVVFFVGTFEFPGLHRHRSATVPGKRGKEGARTRFCGCSNCPPYGAWRHFVASAFLTKSIVSLYGCARLGTRPECVAGLSQGLWWSSKLPSVRRLRHCVASAFLAKSTVSLYGWSRLEARPECFAGRSQGLWWSSKLPSVRRLRHCVASAFLTKSIVSLYGCARLGTRTSALAWHCYAASSLPAAKNCKLGRLVASQMRPAWRRCATSAFLVLAGAVVVAPTAFRTRLALPIGNECFAGLSHRLW